MTSDSLSSKIKNILNRAVGMPDGPAGVVYGAIDKNGELLVCEAAGYRTLRGEEPMTPDSTFALCSLTKLLTAIAALQLVEHGKLSLDDPIHHILPEINSVNHLVPNGSLVIPSPHTDKITLRMLLTHTAGFGYTIFNPCLTEFWRASGDPDELSGIRKCTLGLPLIYEPGTRWEYGSSIDWAGEAVAKISELSLGAYLTEHLFKPLGIADEIGFHLTPALESKLVAQHQRYEDGTLHVTDRIPLVYNAPFESGGGGALGTLRAYLTVLATLLNDGVGPNGARILNKETVRSMFVNQLPDDIPGLHDTIPNARNELSYPITTPVGMKKGWGLSFELNLDPLPTGRSANSGAWAGLANLYYSVDPTKGVATLIMSQSFPFFDPAVTGPFAEAEAAVYAYLK